MKEFNILDRSQNVHQNYLLEASAGTGKTFSIQNIVVRLLTEPQNEKEVLLLEEILVVTFTRAATRDLKTRIRSNIEKALHLLEDWLRNETINSEAPDYLLSIVEKGEEPVKNAVKSLQRSLFNFDQAAIFTIHSFCSRMLRQFPLEGDMGFSMKGGEHPLSLKDVKEIIQDYFRTEIHLEHLSPGQLETILKGDPKQEKLLYAVQKGSDWCNLPSFQEQFTAFLTAMKKITEDVVYDPEQLIEDFKLQLPYYKNRKNSETKQECLEKGSRFANFFASPDFSIEHFDELVKEGLVWTSALDPSLAKGKSLSSSTLHYPFFTERLVTHLAPLVEEWGDFSFLLARLAAGCQKFLRNYNRQEEKFSPDDLLTLMNQALDKSPFFSHVQGLFKGAIIDEFQDTDPLQWKIFSRLFLPTDGSWNGYLYLVGDPKQSIYSFRQADIYTYLSAAERIGENHRFSLSVNYRSKPHLVNALNLIFSEKNAPEWIPLPKIENHLPYQSVKSSEKANQTGHLHFIVSDLKKTKNPTLQDLETLIFFPFIAKEILRLYEEQKLPLNQCAVLVRDRYQGLRLSEYFESKKIPYTNQRRANITDSPVLKSLTNVIHAVLRPRNSSALQIALGSSLMGWTKEDFQKKESLDPLIILFSKLRFTLMENTFADFFEELLTVPCTPKGQTISEFLLSAEGGIFLYRDLRQIGDLIAQHENKEWRGAEEVISFLDHLYEWEANEDPRLQRLQDPSSNGVNILSLHFSKGLEFTAVFALGLVNRTPIKDEWIPISNERGETILTPRISCNALYEKYSEELDAEKMRQLYVGLTRAKDYLYIPVTFELPTKNLGSGEASPIELFLARLGRPPASFKDLYERLKEGIQEETIHFFKANHLSFSLHNEIAFSSTFPTETNLKLIPPIHVSISAPSLLMTSFSSMHRSAHHLPKKGAPKEYEAPIKTPHTLPANSETGLLLHKILEEIEFASAKKWDSFHEALPFILPYIKKSRFEQWGQVIAQIIFNTLKTPLNGINSSFCLADLNSKQMYREMPFLFEHNQIHSVPEVLFEEGIIKGVIDLVFLHEGHYYICDWKSNWLGEKTEAYDDMTMENAMNENGYFLQLTLYKEAVKRYLNIIEESSFEDSFGGGFYLFLRGIQPTAATGIYPLYQKN